VSTKPNLVAKILLSLTEYQGYQCMMREWVSINGIFRHIAGTPYHSRLAPACCQERTDHRLPAAKTRTGKAKAAVSPEP
jgi:hypothetical protein